MPNRDYMTLTLTAHAGIATGKTHELNQLRAFLQDQGWKYRNTEQGIERHGVPWERLTMTRQAVAIGPQTFASDAPVQGDDIPAGYKVDPDVQIARRLTNRKGGDMSEWPPELRVREMPRGDGKP